MQTDEKGRKGVWRTIRGRRVFIAEGEDLETAMKNSGKFDNLKSSNEAEKYYSKLSQYQAREDLDMRKQWLDDNIYDKSKRAEYEDFYKKGEEYYNKKYSRINTIDDKTIKSIKTQKALKQLVENGSAKDITRLDDRETKALREKHGHLERVKILSGTYGMNGALLRSSETGEYFVITARNSNLFYWV